MQGCVSLRGGETNDFVSPRLCYKCGEGGHYARACTSFANVTLSVHLPELFLYCAIFFYVDCG